MMWGRLLCWLGLHSLETVKVWKCRAWSKPVFAMQAVQVDAETHLFRCSRCGVERAGITDGQQWSSVDVGFVKRRVGG